MVSLLEVQQLVSSLGQDHAANLVQNLETSKYVLYVQNTMLCNTIFALMRYSIQCLLTLVCEFLLAVT
jgi:hypothetical protein